MSAEIIDRLRALGFAKQGEQPVATPLDGGVSSDIWRVDLESGPVCVKRALPKLKVERDWQAPVGRSLNEARWLEFAAAAEPGSVPRVLAVDEPHNLFVMEWLDPAAFPPWKPELLAGKLDVDCLEQACLRLGRLHLASTRQPELAQRFGDDALFRAIRLEPYFAGAADRHADLEEPLHRLIERTLASKHALVHGDVSPKNILKGPNGPVFLDAECAWWGDPAFDIAFLLNHILLKCLHVPPESAHYLFWARRTFLDYRGLVEWEPRPLLEARAAVLLPALMLARIDGKSPVEYVTRPAQKRVARAFARKFLLEPVGAVGAVIIAWQQTMFAWMRAGLE